MMGIGPGREQRVAHVPPTLWRPGRQGVATIEVVLMLAVIVVSAVVCFQSLGRVATESADVASGAVDDGTLVAFEMSSSDDDDGRDSTVEQCDDGPDDGSRRISWRDRFRRWLRIWWSR